MNHSTAQCCFKGKPIITCDICGKISHEGVKCWWNLANKGKGQVNQSCNDKGKKKGKPKECANVAEESDSDGELEKSFTTHVTISDESEMSKAYEAKFSAYSWILDSGTTMHICAQREVFITFETIPPHTIKGLGDKPLITCGQGTVLLRMCIGENKYLQLSLTKVLYVPKACQNLISIRHIDNTGSHVECTSGHMFLCDANNNQLAKATLKSDLYYLDAEPIPESNKAHIALKIKCAWTWEEWHRQLGHIGISGLWNLHSKNLVDGFSLHNSPQDFECKACIKAKTSQLPLTCTKLVGCKTKYIPVCCKTFDPIFEISPYSHGQNA